MSFTPLPKTFTDICLDTDHPAPRILELGCGDGRFREILNGLGIVSLGLDHVGPDRGTVADLVGDARVPPVAVGSLDLLLAPNLVRHLVPSDATLGFLARWLELLKPRGSLFIFEDEPREAPPGAAHYRDLQDFLCRLMPESRGPLLPSAKFRSRALQLGLSVAWEFGLIRNRQTLAAEPVLEFLGQGGEPGGEAGRLMQAIRNDGLDPGFFWWARASAVPEGQGT